MKFSHKQKLFIYFAFTLLCMGCIFFFSAQNADTSQELSDGLLAKLKALIALLPSISGQGAEHDIRKYAHLFEFCMLGIGSALTAAELWNGRASTPALPPVTAWAFGALYACTDELHQYFVPGRSAQLSDVALDSFGVLLGVAFVFICRYLSSKGERGEKDE